MASVRALHRRPKTLNRTFKRVGWLCLLFTQQKWALPNAVVLLAAPSALLVCHCAARRPPDVIEPSRTVAPTTLNVAHVGVSGLSIAQEPVGAAVPTDTVTDSAAQGTDSSLDGPPCSIAGPSAQAVILNVVARKPPAASFVVNLQLRNPLKRKLWALFNVIGTFPCSLSNVELARTAPGPECRHWTYNGSGIAQALHLPPETELTIRNVELEVERRVQSVRIYFVDEITIGGTAAEKWFGHEGLAPRAGQFSLEPSETLWTRHVADSDEVIMDLHLRCWQNVAEGSR